MSVHSFALQTTIYATLTADSTLSALVENIYDDVPERSTYPYVVIGDDTVNNNGTKTVDGNEHTLTLHAWAQSRGRKTVKEIMERTYELLHNANLTVTGANLVNLRAEFQTSMMDGDGITRHGVQRFRAVIFDQ